MSAHSKSYRLLVWYWNISTKYLPEQDLLEPARSPLVLYGALMNGLQKQKRFWLTLWPRTDSGRKGSAPLGQPETSKEQPSVCWPSLPGGWWTMEDTWLGWWDNCQSCSPVGGGTWPSHCPGAATWGYSSSVHGEHQTPGFLLQTNCVNLKF